MAYHKNTATVTAAELEVLRKYRTQNSLALTAYLDLRSNNLKATAEYLLKDRLQARLRKLGIDSEEQGLLQEDLELIQIYLNTNGNRKATSIAVFSCAEELFWRAYLLPVPVDMHVHIGAELDLEPLLDVLEQIQCENLAPETMVV